MERQISPWLVEGSAAGSGRAEPHVAVREHGRQANVHYTPNLAFEQCWLKTSRPDTYLQHGALHHVFHGGDGGPVLQVATHGLPQNARRGGDTVENVKGRGASMPYTLPPIQRASCKGPTRDDARGQRDLPA
jgi:hypothetical protein